MKLWCWLNANAGALQSIGTLIGVALATLSIYVLSVTWAAIKRQAVAAEAQADAARALTRVALDQTNAAIAAAAAAQQQSDLLSKQIEQSIAPLLVAEPDDRQRMNGYKLVNRGPGVAFKVKGWKGGHETRTTGQSLPISIQPSTLGPQNFAYLSIPPGWEVFTVSYKGTDRQERFTIVYRDINKPQEHVVTKGLQEFYLS
jgi:hypothetical protein